MAKLHGIHLDHKKNTADMAPVRMDSPWSVTLPMNMHIGKPAIPVVKVGDEVKVGTLIGEPDGYISAPIHASVSGTITNIAPMWTSGGSQFTAVTIKSDGLMTLDETIAPPDLHDYNSFIKAVRDSGVVGLGGAGFPTSVKLDVKDLSRVDAVLINGAEFEPYITSDTRTMIDDLDFVREGIELLKKYLKVEKFVIGIEKNKSEAIKSMKKLESDPAVSVKVLPSMYPQGGEKVLTFHATGKVVPEGKLPIDVGCIVINVTTLSAVAKYVKTGMPLVERVVTVDGGAVSEPKNVIVPIGTPLLEVFNFCGGFKEDPVKVLYGGPMMGLSVKDINSPILKNNNAVLAFNAKEGHLPPPTPCIRCGRCVRACPLGLMPLDFARGYLLRDYELLEDRHINLCMECGCCSYVCPAHRPLVEDNKLAKAVLKRHKEKMKGAKN